MGKRLQCVLCVSVVPSVLSSRFGIRRRVCHDPIVVRIGGRLS